MGSFVPFTEENLRASSALPCWPDFMKALVCSAVAPVSVVARPLTLLTAYFNFQFSWTSVQSLQEQEITRLPAQTYDQQRRR